ncbi:cytochrome P450 9e2-like [Chrysoperla carnea]|uniref:cytochrome P450 9e2-like n=1 Tax=Chrysoperla carnea TaxID=189513 RepID=UPI001D093B19|nr:cytochrome P450 9e2-like [Chrysoperla carnea]
MRKSFSDVFHEIYTNFNDCKYVGFYLWRKPALVIRDPELIKMVWSKQFSNFYNNAWYLSEKVDPYFSKSPFFENDQKWKELRHQLTPTLSPGRIKSLFPVFLQGIDELHNFIKKNAINDKNEIDLRDLCSKYTTEVSTQAFFGVKAHAFDNENSDFLNVGKLIFRNSVRSSLESICMMCDKLFAHYFRVKIVNEKAFDFFKKLAVEIMEYRKTNNNCQYNDYFEHLLGLRETYKEYEDVNNIARQLITVFFDSADTTASGITIAMFEIIRHPEVYKKLRNEIDTILLKYNGQLTVEAIQDMNYLDMCISEAFRLNVPLYFSLRDCTVPTEFPMPKEAQSDGSLLVEPGTTIIVPMHEIHRDLKYFNDPDVYDPERFSDERKSTIQKGTYFPFGDGPRMCLGKNFAIAAIKHFIIALVQNYDIKFKPNSNYTLTPNVGIMLNVVLFKQKFMINFAKR